MKIETVNLAVTSRYGGGSSIGFMSDVAFDLDTVLTFNYAGQPKYVRITSVVAGGWNTYLVYRATPYGYSSDLFTKIHDLDPRSLIDCELTEVTDEEALKGLRSRSCYC